MRPNNHLMNAEDLESEFASRAVPYKGGMLLLESGDALALVERARETGIRVLGVDGLNLSSAGTTSPLEHIADFSDSETGGWDESISFIRSRTGQGLVFEVVLDNPAAIARTLSRMAHRALVHWSPQQLQRGLPHSVRAIDPAWIDRDEDGWSLVVRFEKPPVQAGSPTRAWIHFAFGDAPHEVLKAGAILSMFERETGGRARVEVLD